MITKPPIPKSHIITLIHQNLIHAQLIGNLKKAGFQTELYTLQLVEIIYELLKNQKELKWETYSEEYFQFMDSAVEVEVSVRGEKLRELADYCFFKLLK